MRKLVCLVMLAGACGDDDPQRHLDGGMADAPAMFDAPLTPQPVTLTVKIAGTPQPDVRVYFVNPDSSLISNTVTDATGVASALMPNGGYVSAVSPYMGAGPAPVPTGGPPTTFLDLYTFAGVKPGDHLQLTDDPGGQSNNVTLIGALDSNAGVTGYQFWSPCGSGSASVPQAPAMPQVTIGLDPNCSATTDFVVASLDDNNEVVHWVYVPNVTVTATIDLSAMALANTPSTKTYTLQNADAFGTSMNVQQSLLSQKGEVVKQRHTASGKGSPFTTTMDVPNFANAIDVVFSSDFTDANGIGQHTFIDWAPYSNSYSIDVGARMLPDLTASPDLDTTAHAVTWTSSVGGATPDFVIAAGSVSRTGLYVDWRIVAPYAASVQFPTLPTDVADFTIGATDSYEVYGLTLGKVPGGYDAVRAKLFGTTGPLDLLTAATGSITSEMYEPARVARTMKPAKTPGIARWSSRARK